MKRNISSGHRVHCPQTPLHGIVFVQMSYLHLTMDVVETHLRVLIGRLWPKNINKSYKTGQHVFWKSPQKYYNTSWRGNGSPLCLSLLVYWSDSPWNRFFCVFRRKDSCLSFQNLLKFIIHSLIVNTVQNSHPYAHEFSLMVVNMHDSDWSRLFMTGIIPVIALIFFNTQIYQVK